MSPLNLLALSGSLREYSYNTAALTALRQLAPAHINVTVYTGLGDLPLFNPDLEGTTIPAFENLRAALANADGLLIASPEYAHGISGVMKNALDWLVSGEEFVNMPVALINTSPRASHAQAALREVIQTMNGQLIDQACTAIPLLGSRLGASDIIENGELAGTLTNALARFAGAIERDR